MKNIFLLPSAVCIMRNCKQHTAKNAREKYFGYAAAEVTQLWRVSFLIFSFFFDISDERKGEKRESFSCLPAQPMK
jgi:hypothetical protein